MPSSILYSPGVVWDSSISEIRRFNRPRRRLVESNSKNLAERVKSERQEQRQLGGEARGKGKET
jgi:hypothetical protein